MSVATRTTDLTLGSLQQSVLICILPWLLLVQAASHTTSGHHHASTRSRRDRRDRRQRRNRRVGRGDSSRRRSRRQDYALRAATADEVDNELLDRLNNLNSGLENELDTLIQPTTNAVQKEENQEPEEEVGGVENISEDEEQQEEQELRELELQVAAKKKENDARREKRRRQLKKKEEAEMRKIKKSSKPQPSRRRSSSSSYSRQKTNPNGREGLEKRQGVVMSRPSFLGRPTSPWSSSQYLSPYGHPSSAGSGSSRTPSSSKNHVVGATASEWAIGAAGQAIIPVLDYGIFGGRPQTSSGWSWSGTPGVGWNNGGWSSTSGWGSGSTTGSSSPPPPMMNTGMSAVGVSGMIEGGVAGGGSISSGMTTTTNGGGSTTTSMGESSAAAAVGGMAGIGASGGGVVMMNNPTMGGGMMMSPLVTRAMNGKAMGGGSGLYPKYGGQWGLGGNWGYNYPGTSSSGGWGPPMTSSGSMMPYPTFPGNYNPKTFCFNCLIAKKKKK